MMEPVLNAKPFEILVTHVEKEHGLVKVFGQVDLQTSEVVEKYLRTVRDQLEGGAAPQLSSLQVGQAIVARRQLGAAGGSWCRARVVAVDSASTRVVVNLVDHGSTLPLPLANIRTGVHSQLSQVQPLAVSFFLGEVVPPGGDWSKPAIEFISDAVVGAGPCRALVTHRGHGHTFIRLFCGRDPGKPLSGDMVQCGMAVSGLPNIDHLPPAHNYVPPAVPGPPASPLAALYPGPASPGYPPPLAVRVPEYLPTQPPPSVIFRPMHLETGQWYPVYLSSTEGGPGDFCIQLESLNKKLEEVMVAANSTTLRPIPAHSIQAGVPCLARYSLDNTIYRAVVLKKDSSAKVYYLDYGNSEQVALDRVYALPGDQLATQMLSVRCSIYQWPGLGPGDRQRAKLRLETYCDRVLQCRVVTTETGGSFASARTMVQLYEDGQDIGQEIRLWLARPSQEADSCRAGPGGGAGYTHLTLSGTLDVYLSHPVNGPVEFYVSRCDTSAALAAVMRDIHEMSQNGQLFPLNSAQVGGACLARYTDGVWYRAEVTGVSYDRTEVSVYYVDYGNTSTVPLASVGVIPPALVARLPAQAVQCRLSGVHSNTADTVDRWRRVITERIRVKVEGVDSGVHVVAATSLPLPGTSINQEVCSRAQASPGPGRDTEELTVSWVESSNSWYGQLAGHRAELRDFLGRLSGECQQAAQLYREREGREQHRGELCAVLSSSKHASSRYLRAVILKEHKDNVEVRLMDVGGKEKIPKNQVFCLPFEFSKRAEFGIICSFGCNPALTDNKLRDTMINSNLEVRIVKKIGDGVEVSLTNSKSRKLKNNAVGSVLESLIKGDSKLNQLYERQNSKQNNKMNGQQQPNGNGVAAAPVFERGDLRNSLREKRAARDREQQRAAAEAKQGRGLGLASFKAGWRGEAKITWMYSPGHFYIQVDRDRLHFEEMMGRLQEAMAEGRRLEGCRQGQVVAARWSDNCWYRGQVTGVKNRQKMEVFFVDFGNTEQVDREDLGLLPPEFCQLDCQAVRVTLAGAEADWDKMDGKLAKFFDREVYSVEIVAAKDKDGAYGVRMNDGDIVRAMISQKLVRAPEGAEEKSGKRSKKDRKEKEMSSDSDGKSDKTASKQKQKNEKSKMDKEDDESVTVMRNTSFSSNGGGVEEKLSKAAKLRRAGKLFTLGDFPGVASAEHVGSALSGPVTFARSWKEVWVQVKPGTAEEMRARLNPGEGVSSVHGKVVKSIEEGECCVVEHQGAWHRATVTDKLEGGASVGVVLVDTGRAAVLPLARVRDGDFALYDTPPAAIRCKLDNKVDSVDRFLDNGRISARVKSFKDNTFIIKLDKKAKKDKEDGRNKQDVVVVHVESVDKVWVVDKQTMGKLESMMKDLSELETVAMTNIKTGDLCCVRYSEDNELYRAAVTAVHAEDSSVHVTYVDYGNGEVVEAGEVMQLPDTFRELAPAARRVTVKHAGLALDCERSRARLEKAISGDRVSVAAEAEAGDTEAVSFWVGTNKLDLGKTLGFAKEDTINIFHQAESPRLEARVSHAEADTVWLRLEDEELELGPKISQFLQERSRRLGKVQGKVQVGDLVVARYSRDRRHYRARVTQQLGGHKLEVLFIDFGDKEVVEVGWLKSLPAELRLCPGLAMPCSLDTSEDSAECRVVTGAELSRDIGHVTADLVQPRDHVVTLWSRGRRLALVPGGGLAQLPRLRLRLGDTWLGLLCSAAAGGGKQLSIVDVARAGHVRELLEFYRTQVDVSQPVAGHVYCNTVAGVRRRVVVKEGSRGGGPVTLSELDTGTSVRLDPSTSLETVTPRVRRAAPALVTCQPHVSGGGARYQVPDTLVMVHVADQNTLKLVHLKLRVAPTFLQKDDTTVMCKDSKLTLNCEGENILSVSLPAGVWSSNDLVQVRDTLLLASLGAKVHPVTSMPAPGRPLDTVTIAQEAPRSSGHSLNHNNSFQAKWFQDIYSTRNFVAKCEAEDAGVRVTVHPTLPDIHISADTSQDYQLLARSATAATLRLAAAPALFSLEDEKQLVSVAAAAVGDLCLYREEGGQVGRVMVVRVEDEDSVVEVVNVDTGTETICHLTELLGMTAELAAQPPAVITAEMVSQQTTPAVGAAVRGRVVRAAAGPLELRVLE